MKSFLSVPLSLFIAFVTIFTFTAEVAAQEKKGVVKFKDGVKPLILNKTNYLTLVEMFGKDEVQWIGKQIVLYPEQVQFGSKKVPGIRIRAGEEDSLSDSIPF